MELLLVLAIVALLTSLAAPASLLGLDRARESSLKQSLYVTRKALDDYYADRGHFPESLEELVDRRYLRRVPEDPFTRSPDTWLLDKIPAGAGRTGIMDLHSGAEGYRDW